MDFDGTSSIAAADTRAEQLSRQKTGTFSTTSKSSANPSITNHSYSAAAVTTMERCPPSFLSNAASSASSAIISSSGNRPPPSILQYGDGSSTVVGSNASAVTHRSHTAPVVTTSAETLQQHPPPIGVVNFVPVRHGSNRAPYSLQCRNYDSGFGSNLSSGGSAGSAYSSSLGSTFCCLPPPPPYRMRAPKNRYRITRSYSDSKYGSQHQVGMDLRHHVSPRSSWSTTSRSPSPSMSTVSCPEYGDLQDKLHRLESDRESLSLQVSVLNEQVGAQTEKIKDLESLLDDKRLRLDSTEEMLHDEFSTRSTLETNKLDLLAEISNLKIKLAEIERDKYESEQRMIQAQNEIINLQKIVRQRQSEIIKMSGTLKQHIPVCDKSGEIEELRNAVQQLMIDNEEKNQRIEQLRAFVQMRPSPKSSLDYPDSARSAVSSNYFTRLKQQPDESEQIDISTKIRHLLSDEPLEAPLSARLPMSCSYPVTFVESRTQPHSLSYQTGLSAACTNPSAESSYVSLASARTLPTRVNHVPVLLQTPSMAPWYAPSSLSHESQRPINVRMTSSFDHSTNLGQSTTASTGLSQHHLDLSNLPSSSSSSETARQLAAELNLLAPHYLKSPRVSDSSQVKAESLPRHFGQGQKIPKTKFQIPLSASSSGECRQSRSAHPKGFKWLKEHFRPNKRSTSAPNLGLKINHNISNNKNGYASLSNSDDETIHSARQFNEKLKRDKKQRSIKKFISKLKRSNSQEFNEQESNDSHDQSTFKRGANSRSTTGPRLRAWSREPVSRDQVPLRPSLEQFRQWGSETVCDWLSELGLNMYASYCSRYIRSGRHLMSLSPAELEKDLCMRNHLHRKKLMLALRTIEFAKSEPADNMDYHQVLRWLDDIGLPQYRDVFAEVRIDGPVLNMLTVEDLLSLRINVALHHATLSRGIEMLREVDFNLNRLQRKFNSDVLGKGPIPNAVKLWTQHFVSEWLRTIDLTEFTPNLMCAGIHGGLMVLEPTFTADSLASVLNISQQKSLLRRHLTMHFNELLGTEIISAKREVLSRPGAIELTTGLKIKSVKKGPSSNRKKSRTEVILDPNDLICPLTPSRRPSASLLLTFNNSNSLNRRKDTTISDKIITRLESSIV